MDLIGRESEMRFWKDWPWPLTTPCDVRPPAVVRVRSPTLRATVWVSRGYPGNGSGESVCVVCVSMNGPVHRASCWREKLNHDLQLARGTRTTFPESRSDSQLALSPVLRTFCDRILHVRWEFIRHASARANSYRLILNLANRRFATNLPEAG